MIISFSRRFVFIKTNKTAGSSFEAMLSHYLDSSDWVTANQHEEDAAIQASLCGRRLKYLNGPRSELPREIKRRFGQHSSLRDAHTLFPESKDFYSFGILRNPFARMQSSFRWKNGRKIKELMGSGNARDVIEKRLQLLLVRFIESDRGMLDQRGRGILQGASSDCTTWSVNSIFRIEDLNLLKDELKSRTGISIDLARMPYFKSNTVRIPGDLNIWSDEATTMILRRFWWEFEYLGYSRSPLAGGGES